MRASIRLLLGALLILSGCGPSYSIRPVTVDPSPGQFAGVPMCGKQETDLEGLEAALRKAVDRGVIRSFEIDGNSIRAKGFQEGPFSDVEWWVGNWKPWVAFGHLRDVPPGDANQQLRSFGGVPVYMGRFFRTLHHKDLDFRFVYAVGSRQFWLEGERVRAEVFRCPAEDFGILTVANGVATGRYDPVEEAPATMKTVMAQNEPEKVQQTLQYLQLDQVRDFVLPGDRLTPEEAKQHAYLTMALALVGGQQEDDEAARASVVAMLKNAAAAENVLERAELVRQAEASALEKRFPERGPFFAETLEQLRASRKGLEQEARLCAQEAGKAGRHATAAFCVMLGRTLVADTKERNALYTIGAQKGGPSKSILEEAGDDPHVVMAKQTAMAFATFFPGVEGASLEKVWREQSTALLLRSSLGRRSRVDPGVAADYSRQVRPLGNRPVRAVPSAKIEAEVTRTETNETISVMVSLGQINIENPEYLAWEKEGRTLEWTISTLLQQLAFAQEGAKQQGRIVGEAESRMGTVYAYEKASPGPYQQHWARRQAELESLLADAERKLATHPQRKPAWDAKLEERFTTKGVTGQVERWMGTVRRKVLLTDERHGIEVEQSAPVKLMGHRFVHPDSKRQVDAFIDEDGVKAKMFPELEKGVPELVRPVLRDLAVWRAQDRVRGSSWTAAQKALELRLLKQGLLTPEKDEGIERVLLWTPTLAK